MFFIKCGRFIHIIPSSTAMCLRMMCWSTTDLTYNGSVRFCHPAAPQNPEFVRACSAMYTVTELLRHISQRGYLLSDTRLQVLLTFSSSLKLGLAYGTTLDTVPPVSLCSFFLCSVTQLRSFLLIYFQSYWFFLMSTQNYCCPHLVNFLVWKILLHFHTRISIHKRRKETILLQYFGAAEAL